MKLNANCLKSLIPHSLPFLIPLTIRLAPEIISWPYPTGFDSLMYVNAMLGGFPFNGSPLTLIKSTYFFYILAWATNSLIGNLLVTMKILGSVIFSTFCASLYVYAKKVLKWNYWKSLLVSVLAGSYFVSLGMSWQMYRMALGLVFLMVALSAIRIENFKIRIIALAISFLLTVWSHEIATVTLFLLTVFLFVTGHADRRTLMIVLIPSILLFIYQLYDPVTGRLYIPIYSFYSVSPLNSALYVSNYMLYALLPLSPLIITGLFRFRHFDMLDLSLICLMFIYMPVYLPQYAGFWYRWALIIIYPMLFFAVEGLEWLWKAGRNLNRKLKLSRLFAISILTVNFIMTAYYVASPPENQIKYFGDWNNYKAFIPTSMLQNSIPLSDTPYVIKALKWIKSNLNNHETSLVLHESIDNWAGIIIGNNIDRIRINEANISSPNRPNTAEKLIEAAKMKLAEGKTVYTIWWANGKGWYNMSTLPSQFQEIIRFGDIAVYKYAP